MEAHVIHKIAKHINKQFGERDHFDPQSATCFFCKEPGHIRKDCPKLQQPNNRGRRVVRGGKRPFNPAWKRPQGKRFSSVFGRGTFNNKRGYKKFTDPGKKFKVYAKHSRGTGGGRKIHLIYRNRE